MVSKRCAARTVYEQPHVTTTVLKAVYGSIQAAKLGYDISRPQTRTLEMPSTLSLDSCTTTTGLAAVTLQGVGGGLVWSLCQQRHNQR
jgi:hypothetical protein